MTPDITTVCDDDIIQIDTDVFKNALMVFDCKTISQSLMNRKQEILKQYQCFNPDKPTPPREKKIFKSDDSRYTNNCSFKKIHLITGNFTEDSAVKKEFTGILNKLTQQNKDVLLPKLENFIKTADAKYHSVIYGILWNSIKQSCSSVYFEIVSFFPRDIVNNKIEMFVKNKQWMPCNDILDNNILNNDPELYDMYCDYVKWKKQTINLFEAISILSKTQRCNGEFVEILLYDVFSLFKETAYEQSKDKKHIIDFALEAMKLFLHTSHNKEIIEYLKNIKDKMSEKSSVFLIMDIIEKN